MVRKIVQGTRDTTFLEEKSFKAGLSGITKLKEGKYTSRYRVGGSYGVQPDGWIIEKPKGTRFDGKKSEKKPLGDSKKNSYTINKTVIRQRTAAMVNMLQNSNKISRPKLYFFTVSFLIGTPDKICYKLLNTWLTSLRMSGSLKSYLWVSEDQKNGTLHYHMLVPHYLNVEKANRTMKKHLIDLSEKGELPGWDRAKIRKYNGIDIAKDRKTKRIINFASPKRGKALANYLTKYVTKNDTGELEHFAWHNSRDWSGLILGMCFTRKEIASFVSGKMLDHAALETDHAFFYRWSNFKPPGKLIQHLAQMNYGMLRYITGQEGNYLYSLN